MSNRITIRLRTNEYPP